MYVAATRQSALDPSFPPNNPQVARPLADKHGEEPLLNARVLRTVGGDRTQYIP